MSTATFSVLGALPLRLTVIGEVTAAPASGIGTSSAFSKTMPPPAGLTVQVKAAVPVFFAESVTVTVTLCVPVAVGVPEIRPVLALIDRPAGSPLAAYDSAPA